jgi:uncharacterized protein (DUF1015 family)
MENPVNQVKPFKALHYNPERVKDIGACLSQPYDVISSAAQDAYYRQDEHNVIRLILGKIEPTDTDANNRYTRAAGFLSGWKTDGVLVQDDEPSFFVYEQTFSLPGGAKKKLTGFIGLARLSAYGEGKVLPHELVMKKPVQDRIALTLAANTQFEYIWGLYRDKERAIDGLLDRTVQGRPLVAHTDAASGVGHRLFRLTDPAQCRSLEEAMCDKQIYIADGHHRYQTMIDVRDELNKKHPEAGPDAPWNYIMMFLVSAGHEGLVILPTHRLLHSCPAASIEKLQKSLPDHFTVTRFAHTPADEATVRGRWLAALEKTAQPAFGVVLQAAPVYLLIELKDAAAYRASLRGQATDAWKMLDVNVLNILVLQNMMGFTDEMMSLQSSIDYCKDASEAIERVGRGEMQAAFILKGTSLPSVLTVADADEKMPRKSTFFYPKPLSGLVFYEME